MTTTVHSDLGGISNFDCSGIPTTVGERCKKWRLAFESFVDGKGVKDPNQMKALELVSRKSRNFSGAFRVT